MSIMPTSPTRWKTCWHRCVRSPPAASSWCSAAAATATGQAADHGRDRLRLADVVIVTDDNPRSEVPASIRAEIMAAAPGAIEIGDRAEAIREAVGMLTSGDTLIVAGKGHEEGPDDRLRDLPFSDHAELRKALEELTSHELALDDART
jgi:hypothetical protein